MDERLIFCAGGTRASGYACALLQERGYPIAQLPSLQVTHLLLDVPSFGPGGELRCGGAPEELLCKLPPNVTICGGNLNHPALSAYKTLDLLQDAAYLAENAYITAECALDVALPHFSGLLRGCPVLIIGGGRIGKCLGQLLKNIGADVTIAARKESDRAMLAALGCRAVDTAGLTESLPRYRLIFNTAPAPILSREQTAVCHPDCLKIDLASKPGIAGEHVIWARGLPGIHRPEASGGLIANTLIRLFQKEEIL